MAEEHPQTPDPDSPLFREHEDPAPETEPEDGQGQNPSRTPPGEPATHEAPSEPDGE